MDTLSSTEKNDIKNKHILKLSGILSPALNHLHSQKLTVRGGAKVFKIHQQPGSKYSLKGLEGNLYLQLVYVSQTHVAFK